MYLTYCVCLVGIKWSDWLQGCTVGEASNCHRLCLLTTKQIHLQQIPHILYHTFSNIIRFYLNQSQRDYNFKERSVRVSRSWIILFPWNFNLPDADQLEHTHVAEAITYEHIHWTVKRMLLVVNKRNIDWKHTEYATLKTPQALGFLAFYGSLNLITIWADSITDPYWN